MFDVVDETIIEAMNNNLCLDNLLSKNKSRNRFNRIYRTLIESQDAILLEARIVLMLDELMVLNWKGITVVVENDDDNFNMIIVFPVASIRQKIQFDVLMNYNIELEIVSLPAGHKTKKVCIPPETWGTRSTENEAKLANFLVVETLHRFHTILAV